MSRCSRDLFLRRSATRMTRAEIEAEAERALLHVLSDGGQCSEIFLRHHLGNAIRTVDLVGLLTRLEAEGRVERTGRCTWQKRTSSDQLSAIAAAVNNPKRNSKRTQVKN
jgi:hypothetical protein